MNLHTFHTTHITFNSLEENKPTEVIAGDKKACILRRGDKVFAFAALCPHSGAPMCDGWVDPLGRVVCPLHKYRFDPANGRNTSGEGYKMVTYPIEIRNDEIFIGMLPASPKDEDIVKDNGLSLDDDIERW